MNRILFSGLMLMSFYFGAGNLIFAPQVGLESGHNVFSALSGFTLSAVVIPFVTLVAVTFTGDSGLSFYGRVGKTFGYALIILLVISLGPLFAIPRVANVSYELGIQPLIKDNIHTALPIDSSFGLVYITLFFLISYTLSLYGDRLVDTIGKYLSPALVIFILALVVTYLAVGHDPSAVTPTEKYLEAPFATGAIDGYGTLDALASVIFGGLVLQMLRPSPETPMQEVRKSVIQAGFIACLLLAIIYFGLGLLGNYASGSEQTSGAQILIYASTIAFGKAGIYIFAIIVFLACLTTAVGLLKTIANYSHNLFGIFSEKGWLILYTLSSAVLSVQGLASVIKTSIPFIYFTYPITISLVIVTMFNKFTKDRVWVYRWVMIFVVPFAAADCFKFFSTFYLDKSIDILGWLRPFVPFGTSDFSWFVPMLVGAAVGLLFPKQPVVTYLLGDREKARRDRKQQAEDEFEDVV
ncbi:branched-chain amino acid transport system II carrier protein [Psittacicella gerlachiana]|uniref:Branched-chain amino acid transport system carrier protein n=1 Tax=Psittacicella gerlachiana TaxID=2028574 RepID=A0A3A1YG90_9GAMM|nr:branched-chain amino acid transport system II carrier protein [Psittacicella gerlachiana]RIY36695.1 branched-chain amino acid transport system II carrier protein [Psittacicella gerlachiana]